MVTAISFHPVSENSPAGLIMPLLHNISRVISSPADSDRGGKNRLESLIAIFVESRLENSYNENRNRGEDQVSPLLIFVGWNRVKERC